MADNSHRDKQFHKPTHDDENPSVLINNIPSAISNNNTSTGNGSHVESSRSISKTMKLVIVLLALSVAVVLGVTLSVWSLRDGAATKDSVPASAIAPSIPTSESSIKNESSNEADNTPTVQNANGAKPEPVYFTSDGPIESRVKMISPSIVNGYESCSDLESDITEVLKLYMNNFIKYEAVSGEKYANCDPENDDWMWGLYGYSHYFYYDEVNYICSPASNSSNGTHTGCATDSTEVPWVVTWLVIDYAEGKIFYNETEARVEYESIDPQLPKRLYDPSKSVIEEVGSMPESMWCQLESWAYNAQCEGKAPSSRKIMKSTTKQSRSFSPNAKAGSSIRRRTRGSKIGDKFSDSYDLNNQNDSANEHDKVVSDGTYIYAAYGDVLYAWTANDTTLGVSITKMPRNETSCAWNDATLPCITTAKPEIEALFLGNSRLTVIMSQMRLTNSIDGKTHILVFDTSDVSLGSPLKQLGSTELRGEFSDGRSIGDKIIIATGSLIDTWTLERDLSRSQSQYCGLDSQSYTDLAVENATASVQSLAKQIVTDLELVDDCSRIFQLAMLRSSSDDSDTNMTNMKMVDILGSFVHISSFDLTSDLSGGGDISVAIAGAFVPGYDWLVYLADDFLAVAIDTTSSLSQTFLLGFDLSTKAGAVPFCYRQIPGNVDDNYLMDMWDGHLRVASTNFVYNDFDYLNVTSVIKVYVLEIPSTQGCSGKMSLVGEVDISGDGIAGTRFDRDKAYFSVVEWNAHDHFLIVDLSDHLNPRVVGNLAINGTFSYLQEIDMDNNTYVLGIGSEIDGYWQTNITMDPFIHMKLSLFDVNTPLSPTLTALYKDVAGSYSIATHVFLAVRFLPESTRLVIPVSRSYDVRNYSYFFSVFDISKDSITPDFNVTHSTSESFCWSAPSLPRRSFVFQSELTTVDGHTVIRTDMQSGSFISELDLDVGLNYSVCGSPWHQNYNQTENYGYDYNDVVEGILNETEPCKIPNSIQADIVDICTDTEFASLSFVFNLTSISYCNDGKLSVESMGNVSSVDECAQKCVEKHNGQNASSDTVQGLQYDCDGNCVCLVDSDEITDLNLNISVASGCYVFAYAMGATAIKVEGVEDDAYNC